MTYKKTANWSDGKPVTGADFMALYRTTMNPNWDITSREGFEDIAKIQVKGKSVTVTFKPKRAYAAWDVLLGSSPLPAHKVAGQDFNKLWADSVDISSGPYKFQSWQKGTQLTLVKNAAFKAGPAAKLDRVVFRYITGPSQYQALKSGEGDLIDAVSPQIQIVDFYKDSKFKVEGGASYSWEHLDFQQGAKAHPALKKKFVRQAIIQGINRSQIREVLYIKTGLVPNPKDLPVLQSNIYKPFEAAYATPYKRWSFSQKNAIALLKKNGCTGGPDTPSSGNSKIFCCPGVGELTFPFTTTSGNPLRALTFEIIQRQLKSVGIKFTPRFLSPAVLFGGGALTGGDWQAVMYTFTGGPDQLGHVLRHRWMWRRPELRRCLQREGIRTAEEGAVHRRRGGAEQDAPRRRGHPGGRGLLDPAVLTPAAPAVQHQGQGRAQEPDPAGRNLERRDLECYFVVPNHSTCRASALQEARVPPRPLGRGGTSF